MCYYFAPSEERSIVMTVSVCLWISLYINIILQTTCPNFTKFSTKFSVYIAWYRCLVHSWQHCNALCNSGFLDVITFSSIWPLRPQSGCNVVHELTLLLRGIDCVLSWTRWALSLPAWSEVCDAPLIYWLLIGLYVVDRSQQFRQNICFRPPSTLQIFIWNIKENFVKQNFRWNFLSQNRTCSILRNRISKVIYFESRLFTTEICEGDFQ